MKTKLFKQIFRFIIVGGIATIIDWTIYYILFNIFEINPLITNILSFSVAVVYNCIASIKWVFTVDENKNKKQIFIEFVILSIIGLIISEILLYIFVDTIKINEMISKVLATIIVMTFNFVTRKMFLEK